MLEVPGPRPEEAWAQEPEARTQAVGAGNGKGAERPDEAGGQAQEDCLERGGPR